MFYHDTFGKYRFFRFLNRFYSSEYYVYLIAFVTFLSEVFSLEIAVYYFYVFFGLLVPAICTEDMKSFLAPVFFGYFSVSLRSNHGEVGITLFSKANLPHLVFLILMIFLITLSRIIYGIWKKEFHPRPRMLFGYLALCTSFPLAGVLSPYYSSKNIAFGLLLSFSYLVPYLLSYYLIDYRTLGKDYFAHLLTALGLLLSGELLFIYASHFQELIGGTFYNGFIRTGWGMKNNLGGMLSLSIVGPFYLAMKKDHVAFYLTLNFFFLLMVALTESRASLLLSLIAEIMLFVTGLFWRKEKRKSYLLTFLCAFLLSLLVLFLLRFLFPSIMESVISTLKHLTLEGLSSSRLEIWSHGLSYFREYPFFGSGYYRLPDQFRMNYFYTDFLPTRMHNTYVQLLASTGLVGILAYLYHRLESALLIFHRFTKEKMFLFYFYFLFLGCSAFDCHFFNIGPALLYSVMAAIAEGLDIQERSQNVPHVQNHAENVDVTNVDFCK